MGRPKANYSKKLHDLFTKHEEEVIEDDKVAPPKSDIWSWLRKELKAHAKDINEKAIYSAALRWWKSKVREKSLCMGELGNEFEMTVETTVESSLNSSDEKDLKALKFSVQLSHSVWENIKPVEIEYCRKNTKKAKRTYVVLQPGVWTNVIVDRIAQKKDIPCEWAFKKNKCYQDRVIFQANCVNCSANLFGAIDNIPVEKEPVTIKIEVYGLNLRRHETANRNVKIVGERIKNIIASGKPAIAVRRDILAKSTSIFKKPKGRVISANAIRCARYRARAKEKLSPCIYTALSYLKWSSKYMNSIHSIGMDPFCVSYTTPDQLKLYNAYKMKNSFTKMSGDLTGGVVRKLARPGGKKSKAVLLGSLVISDGFQVSTSNVLSEKNNGNFLTYWLSEWVNMAKHIPNQFTCDMSIALLNAAVRSFAFSPSVAAYLDLMFNIAKGESNSKCLPPCYVRIDIAHLIKNVVTCDALKTAPKKVRDFYIRSVALLLQVDNVRDAERLIVAILTIANSKTEGYSEDALPVPCETHKTYIISKISGDIQTAVNETISSVEKDITNEVFDNDNEDEDEDHSNEIEIEVEKIDVDDTNLNSWLTDIANQIKETLQTEDNGDRDNLMHNSKFSKFFVDLCKLLPLWTGMCYRQFKGAELIASSANAESYFKDLKLCHGDIIPCQADKFVEEDLNRIKGMIIDASQNYIEYVDGVTNMDTTNDETEVMFNDSAETVNNETNTFITDVDMSNIYISHITDKIDHDNNDYIDTDIGVTNKLLCPACADNNLPTGAHICSECGKKVHILPGCSISCGDNEGFGEKRICSACSNEKFVAVAIEEMDQTEKWSKKSRSKIKKSKYIQPAPNWHLNTNIDKKLKIGILTNGNLSTNVYKVSKELVALQNTCAFDSVAQILTAAFAYVTSFRNYMENSKDEIFKIAIALGKNEHMRKINTMRAVLLHSIFKTNQCAIVSTSMIKALFKHTPCYVEVHKCDGCNNSTQAQFHTVLVENSSFNNDLSKLNNAIIGNFAKKSYCQICKTDAIILYRQFKNHLFIEIPSCGKNNSVFEPQCFQQLSKIPLAISLQDKKFVLFGALLFIPPYIENDIGHYIAVIKINENWEAYDDMRSKSFPFKGTKKVILHSLFYVQNDN